ncbi:MAG: DUF1329 domain-containing protein [Pseudoxanthomonas sp.]
MKKIHGVLVLAGLLAGSTVALQAAVPAEEAAKLGTTLTPLGAEKAGNADGSIPAYTGGLTTAPAGFKKGSAVLVDPFAGEKPLFTIDAKNAGQYAGKLTEGAKALLKSNPGFRMEVYPSHRSMAFPKSVQDNTIKNATRAKLTEDGIGVTGAWGGIPFPIPKNGNEAIQNHLLRYRGVSLTFPKANVFYIDPSGKRNVSSIAVTLDEWPYYGSSEGSTDILYRSKAAYSAPARRVGEAVIAIDPVNNSAKSRRAWSYLPGQRRVRVAPDIAYDTPNPSTGSMSTYDDIGMLTGKIDRFNWKLVGKREIYVPYNNYRALFAQNPDEIFPAKAINPNYGRWELHRVWVVEATLKAGKRHVYSKRTYYLDEDSWYAVANDQYDGRGQLWRTNFQHTAPSYEALAPAAFIGGYDLIANSYYIYQWPSTTGLKFGDKLSPDAAWTPDALAQSGIR